MNPPADVVVPGPAWRLLGGASDLWLRVPAAVRCLLPVAAMAALWWSSSKPASGEPASSSGALLHNAMHIVAYGCLAASVWLAWSRRPASAARRGRSLGAVLVAVAYGVVDELHQSQVDGRSCSVLDVVSDAAGATLAVALLFVANGVDPRRDRSLVGLAVTATLVGACSVVLASFW